jgi:hypothetical protein
MSALNNLINQKVVAEIEGEGKTHQIEGTVIGVDVNDFFFYEKGEPIYISVSLNPTEQLPDEIDVEELHEIPLSNIRKA